MNQFLKRAKEIENEIISNRRYIHKNAEINDELPKTTNFVKIKLKEMGYEPKEICKSGIVATVGNKNINKVILLRADMDALPMKEENDLSFKSVTNNSHLCGHDTHTAMLLGAAKLLKEREDELNGVVKLMFQPNEEGMKGAKNMVDSGALENPKVDAAIALHVDALSPSGNLKYGRGCTFASCDCFKITIKGQSGHGARPNESIDPINVAAHIHLALQALISRESIPSKTNVLTICSINSGDSYNTIPDTAVMKGSIRTFDNQDRELLVSRIKEVCKLTARTFRAEAVVDIVSDTPPLYCEEKFSSIILNYTKEIVEEKNISTIPVVKMGSEDFALVTQRVPSTYLFLGAGVDNGDGYKYGQHNTKVIYNEDIFYLGSAIHAHCAMKWLSENLNL